MAKLKDFNGTLKSLFCFKKNRSSFCDFPYCVVFQQDASKEILKKFTFSRWQNFHSTRGEKFLRFLAINFAIFHIIWFWAIEFKCYWYNQDMKIIYMIHRKYSYSLKAVRATARVETASSLIWIVKSIRWWNFDNYVFCFPHSIIKIKIL